MDPLDLMLLRKTLRMSQHQFGEAMNQSYATINRWERSRRPIPADSERVLDCLSALVAAAKAGRNDLTLNDVSEAVKALGVLGVVVIVASAGELVPRATVLRLTGLPAYKWLGFFRNTSVIGTLTFLRKITNPVGGERERTSPPMVTPASRQKKNRRIRRTPRGDQ